MKLIFITTRVLLRIPLMMVTAIENVFHSFNPIIKLFSVKYETQQQIIYTSVKRLFRKYKIKIYFYLFLLFVLQEIYTVIDWKSKYIS